MGAVDYKGDYAMFSSAGTGYQSTIKPDVCSARRKCICY
ncbi:hypothetical protein [Algibacter miyuki]